MSQTQNTLCTTFLHLIKLVLRVFADNTTFANYFGSFDGWEAFNNGIFLKLLQLFEVQMTEYIMPQSTDLIPMSQESGVLCILHKLGKHIGLSMMVFYSFCIKFPRCNLSDLNIIQDESNSLGLSSMSHLKYTQNIGGQGGYIHNIRKAGMFKFYNTFVFRNDLRIISHMEGNAFVSVQG